jgi:hypothetical protein
MATHPSADAIIDPNSSSLAPPSRRPSWLTPPPPPLAIAPPTRRTTAKAEFKAHDVPVTALATNPINACHLITGAADGCIHMWNLRDRPGQVRRRGAFGRVGLVSLRLARCGGTHRCWPGPTRPGPAVAAIAWRQPPAYTRRCGLQRCGVVHPMHSAGAQRRRTARGRRDLHPPLP